LKLAFRDDLSLKARCSLGLRFAQTGQGFVGFRLMGCCLSNGLRAFGDDFVCLFKMGLCRAERILCRGPAEMKQDRFLSPQLLSHLAVAVCLSGLALQT